MTEVTKVGFQLASSLASKHLTDAEFIKGSYFVVNTIEERNEMTIATDSADGTIVAGSLCYCQAEDKLYQFTGTNWVEKSVLSTTDKQKLAGIAAGAEVNVQANWTETNASSDAYIKNKPDLEIYATKTEVSQLISHGTTDPTSSTLTKYYFKY